MDDYYNLRSSTCPPSPPDSSDLEQVAANTPAQDFAVNCFIMGGLITRSLLIPLLEIGGLGYISLESTLFGISVKTLVKCKSELLLKMETPPSFS